MFQTFQRVNNDKEIYELRSLLLEITDYDLFMRGFEIPVQYMTDLKKESFVRLFEKRLSQKVNRYFLFLVPVPKDGHVFENETQFDRINKIKDDIFVEIGKKGVQMVGNKAKQVFKGQEQNIDKAVGFIQENAKETDPRIRKLVAATEGFASGRKPKVEELTNLVDILSDATDDKTRNIITKTKQAAEKAIKYAEDLSSSQEVGVDRLMDVVFSMAEAAEISNLGVGEQLRTIKQIVTQVMEQIKSLKDNSTVDIPKIMDLAVDITKFVAPSDVADKVTAVTGAAKAIMVEAKKMEDGAAIDFENLLKSTSAAIDKLGGNRLAKQLVSEPFLQTAKIASTLIHQSDKLMEANLPFMLEIGSEIVSIVLPKHTEVILKVGVTCKELIKVAENITNQRDPFNRENSINSVTTIIDGAGSVVAVFFPEAKDTTETIKDVCLAVNTACQSIQQDRSLDVIKVTNVVAPILTKYIGAESQQAVTAVISVIDLVAKEAKNYKSGGAASLSKSITSNLPELIENSGKVIKLFNKDPQVDEGIRVAVLGSKLLQARFEELSNLSPDSLLQTCLLALDVMGMISPSVKSRAPAIRSQISNI